MEQEITTACVEEQAYVSIRRPSARVDTLSQTMGEVFGELMGYLSANGVEPAGMPFSRYHSMDGETVDVECGLPVAEPMAGAGNAKPGTLPAGKVATITHLGPYDDLPKSWGRLFEWINAQGLEQRGAPWETYVTDPGMEPDVSKWRTDIYFPVSG